MNINFENKYAYAEVYEILNWLGDEYKRKVPRNLLTLFKEEKKFGYRPKLDFNKPLSDQNPARARSSSQFPGTSTATHSVATSKGSDRTAPSAGWGKYSSRHSPSSECLMDSVSFCAPLSRTVPRPSMDPGVGALPGLARKGGLWYPSPRRPAGAKGNIIHGREDQGQARRAARFPPVARWRPGVHRFRRGVQEVTLRLQGACGGCPHAAETLKLGIEAALREEIDPEIVVEREAQA